jgi:type I restriction enzyme, S subunit
MVRRDSVLGGSMRIKRQFAVRKDDLVVAEIDAKVGGMAVVPADLDGAVVSSHYFAFELDTALVLPGWVSLLCESNHFTRQVRAVGSTNYAAVRPAQVLAYTLPLPPLAEQRRIVDLISAVDAAAARSLSEDEAAQGLAAALRSELITKAAAPRRRLGDVLESIDGGVSPLTEGRAPAPGEPAVLKLSAIRPGLFRPEEAKALPKDIEMPEAALVNVGDVLITRSNTPGTVGYVCLVDRVGPMTYLSDLILRLHPMPDLLSGYLAEALLTDDARAQIVGSARGTSGSMRKISRMTIREVEIPVPVSLDAQHATVALLTSVAHVRDRAHAAAVSTGALRSTLRATLLSGDHEIPASYDRFLDGVA